MRGKARSDWTPTWEAAARTNLNLAQADPPRPWGLAAQASRDAPDPQNPGGNIARPFSKMELAVQAAREAPDPWSESSTTPLQNGKTCGFLYTSLISLKQSYQILGCYFL